MTATIPRSEPPRSSPEGAKDIKPSDYMADMAQAKMAEQLIKQMGAPSIVSKQFVVWSGIWKALNDAEDNRTYFDTSLHCAIYDNVAKNSVNVDGRYFDRAWAYLCTPTYVITQNTGVPVNSFNNEPGLISRLWNRITGKGQQEAPRNG